MVLRFNAHTNFLVAFHLFFFLFLFLFSNVNKRDKKKIMTKIEMNDARVK